VKGKNEKKFSANEARGIESPKRTKKKGPESPIDSGTQERSGSPANFSTAATQISAGRSPPSSYSLHSSFIPIQNAYLASLREDSPQVGFIPVQPTISLVNSQSATPPLPFPLESENISPSFDSMMPVYMSDLSTNIFTGRLTPLFSDTGRFTPTGRWTPSNMMPDGRSTPSFLNYSGRWTPVEFDSNSNRDSGSFSRIIDQ